MDRELSGAEMDHREAAELLGAFALDAVDENEARMVRDHVSRCGACQAELAEHREVLALLTTAWLPPPRGVWDRIAADLGEKPPPLDLSAVREVTASRPPVLPRARRHRRRRLGVAALAVAATAATGLLGYGMIDEAGPGGRPPVGRHSEELGRAAAAALVDPSARRVAMRSEDGSLSVDAVLLADGAGYVLDDNLPPLDTGRTYQLWGIVDGTPVSLGLLGRSPDKFAFRVVAPVAALAITSEDEGGAVLPQDDPLVVGALAP